MMEKEFIPYELAVKLKELGFNEPSFGYWLAPNDTFLKEDLILNLIEGKNNKENGCFAPLWQQAFDWLREKHSLHFEIFQTPASTSKWNISFYNLDSRFKTEKTIYNFDFYNNAKIECLKKLIEIIEDEKENGR